MTINKEYIRFFRELGLDQVAIVGGKNASLGEMISGLTSSEIRVPDGFATTAVAYWEFIKSNDLHDSIQGELNKLDRVDFSNLRIIGEKIRSYLLQAQLPEPLIQAIKQGYEYLQHAHGSDISVAARSSATAEDLPQASFAGQQETYLNITNVEQLLEACKKCFASLFTDRAIKYREDQGFEHMKVALSVGVQLMVRADSGCSGVIFTLDPDSGFDQVIHIAGVWGIGENIVQGTVNPDEFYVFKPTLEQGKQAIIQRKLGSKSLTMVYAKFPESGLLNIDTPGELQGQFILSDKEVLLLANWSSIIERHYGRPMDIEWAKDGVSQELYILQARPETVHSRREKQLTITNYKLTRKSKEICRGNGLGNRIAKGKARILYDPGEASKLQSGDILVTSVTNPDWDPILRKAAAIVTDKGGRTSHAAIVAREMGAVAIVGSGNATELIKDGQEITVCCAEGNEGVVYEGLLDWEEESVNIDSLQKPITKPLLILADPQQAFKLSFYPAEGIGLMRMEFVINNSIRVHPMALKFFENIKDTDTRQTIEQLCSHYPNKTDYFVHKLAEGIATIAAAFYPKQVIVRMSDFKSNEYANLIGGSYFEPSEANPMLGFRGASRYDHPKYRPAFKMECAGIKMVRDLMGLTNVKVMIPFCRTIKEAENVLKLMASQGLIRGEDGLQIYMMVEIPSNVILARDFAKHFDGFSIGSNDLTQLTLGVDRDSELLSDIFDVNDPAVRRMISLLIKSAKETQTVVGLCGQAPSDQPEFAQFLVELGIDSISFNADALFTGIENIIKAEARIPVL
jgi:pyruvate,water dikinase